MRSEVRLLIGGFGLMPNFIESHTYCIGFPSDLEIDGIQCVKLWDTAIYQTFCKKSQVNYWPHEDLSARNFFHPANKWR